MKQSNPHATTSVLSLIAITAGAVSAALVIMFVGLFFTMMSISADTQVSVTMSNQGWDRGIVRVSDHSGVALTNGIKPTRKMTKGHYMDALLRDEGKQHSDISSEQPAPSGNAAHIYVISATIKLPSRDVRLIQI